MSWVLSRLKASWSAARRSSATLNPSAKTDSPPITLLFTQTSVRLHVVCVVDAGKPVSDIGIPKLRCARPVTRFILGITMGAQPPLGVPGQVRLVAGSEFDLENLVRTQSGRADGRSGVIDEHEGALQCLRMTTLRARTVVPQPEHVKPAAEPIVPPQCYALRIVFQCDDRASGLHEREVRHGRFARRGMLFVDGKHGKSAQRVWTKAS